MDSGASGTKSARRVNVRVKASGPPLDTKDFPSSSPGAGYRRDSGRGAASVCSHTPRLPGLSPCAQQCPIGDLEVPSHLLDMDTPRSAAFQTPRRSQTATARRRLARAFRPSTPGLLLRLAGGNSPTRREDGPAHLPGQVLGGHGKGPVLLQALAGMTVWRRLHEPLTHRLLHLALLQEGQCRVLCPSHHLPYNRARG